MKFLVVRLCREREGRRAEVGVGVGGKEESQGGSPDPPQQDSGVRFVLTQQQHQSHGGKVGWLTKKGKRGD